MQSSLTSVSDLNGSAKSHENICTECPKLQKQLERLKAENKIREDKNKKLTAKIEDKESIISELKQNEFCYENIKTDPDLFKSLIGLSPERFNVLYDLCNPGEKSQNIKYYEASKATAQQQIDNIQSDHDYCKTSEKMKSGPPPKENAIEQLFIFMFWLRSAPTLKLLSFLKRNKRLPVSTLSRYLITWSNFLYYVLGSIPIWPTKQQVLEYMPLCFKETYPTTRCIIDCTELFEQVPSSLAGQSALYSSYKHHVTYKVLIGIAPSGAITFVSQLFPGSLSDKEITCRSGFLNPGFWQQGDSVMADRGFTNEENLKDLGVTLNIPAFLDGRDQLERDEVIESQSIASVRIHVERFITRVKKFKLLKSEIPLTMHGSINQVWTVACLLCNFMDPLIRQKNPSLQK